MPDSAETVFAHFLLRRERGEVADIEADCVAHPEQADSLRRMYGRWRRVAVALGSLDTGPEPSVPQDTGGRYVHQGVVARGGMGEIHRVWDTQLERTLACKVLAGGERQARATARFLGEAQVAGQLDHPGVVPVHDIGIDRDGRVFFVMDLVEGIELGEVFERVSGSRDGWTLTRTLGVVQKVCETVAFAHSKGVIHRDLKPANIMVGRFGETYVLDWGLARARSDRGDAAPTESGLLETLEGDVLGTPAYMSPEQARGSLDDVGPHSDVYAVGAILYHLLCGSPPYLGQGSVESAHELLGAIRAGPAPPVHESRTGVPVELASICERAMAYRPADRYPTMEALAADLRAYLEDRVVQAYRTGSLAEFRKWVRRNRGLSLSAAAGLLVLIAVLAVILLIRTIGRRAAEEAQGQAVRYHQELLTTNDQLEVARNEARTRAEEARRRTDELLRLSDLDRVAALRTEADSLWPCREEIEEGLERWLGRADELLERRSLHAGTLETLRRGAGPELGEGQREWWSRQLESLLAELDLLEDNRPFDGTRADIQRRYEVAQNIHLWTISDQQVGWGAAAAALHSDPRFPGFELVPRVGLVPLGVDPASGLCEFALLESGRIPERDEQGRLWIDQHSAIVLVLLPAGSVRLGRELKEEPAGDTQPFRALVDGPSHEVSLEPFFLSKFELTVAQWFRMTGTRPAILTVPVEGATENEERMLPVQGVSWTVVSAALERFDLVLPTEAQWEYAARAGTETAWWSGDDPAALRLAANVADQSMRLAAFRTELAYAGWDDGQPFSAPVGSFAANPFGLHDVHGNVFEWCADWYLSYSEPVREGDGLRQGVDPDRCRVLRGGAFDFSVDAARSEARWYEFLDASHSFIGVRPAMRYEP